MIDINIPIIYINDFDTIRINSIIHEAVPDGVEEWNPGTCLTKFWLFNSLNTDDIDSDERLDNLVRELYIRAQRTDRSATKSILVLREIQDYISEPPVKSLLASIAQRKLYDPLFELTVIIVSSVVNVPEELQPYVSFLDIDYPDEEEILNIVYRHIYVNERDDPNTDFKDKTEAQINDLVNRYISENISGIEEQVKNLLPNFRGMKPFDIDRMVDMAMSRNGTLGADDYRMVLEHKKQLVKKSGVLEVVESNDSIDDIGGLNNLKEYIKLKAIIRQNSKEAADNGIPMPKGIFLVGMPGCGKSLSAKAFASEFKDPLLKLDMGTLMGSKVGESEKNLRKAIKIAEAAAPCVLWVDEIEKGFAGSNNDDNAYLRRMFGYFLSWLQDKTSSVYVIATANNLESLPVEFKRKGRFDDMFFVDLPNKEECMSIFNLKIRKILEKQKNKNINRFLLNKDSKVVSYVADDENKGHHFCGADIEYVVNKAFEMIFLKQKGYKEKDDDKEISIKVPDKISEKSPDMIFDNFLLEIAKETKCIGLLSDEGSVNKMRADSPAVKGKKSPYLPAS